MDDEFKLCWKNFQDNIASGFQNLYDRGDLVDVTLACDGKLLHAHKIVLAICSPYFQEIFHTNPCKHPIIILKDVSFNIMCELLEFMYQGVVNVKHTELQSFMKIGQLLQIKGLATNPAAATSPGSTNSEKSSPANANVVANSSDDVGQTSTKSNAGETDVTLNANDSSIKITKSNAATPVRSNTPLSSYGHQQGASQQPSTQSSKSTSYEHHPYTLSKRAAEFSTESLSIYSRKQLRRSLTEGSGTAGGGSEHNESSDANMEQLNAEDFFLPAISISEPRYDIGSVKRENDQHGSSASSAASVSAAAAAVASLRHPFAPPFGLDYNFYKNNSNSGSSSGAAATGAGASSTGTEYPNELYMPNDYSKNFGNHMDIPPIAPGEHWFHGKLEFMLSQRGKPLLVHDGHTFGIQYVRKDKKYWQCNLSRKFNCKARVTTTDTGDIIVTNNEHCHTEIRQHLRKDYQRNKVMMNALINFSTNHLADLQRQQQQHHQQQQQHHHLHQQHHSLGVGNLSNLTSLVAPHAAAAAAAALTQSSPIDEVVKNLHDLAKANEAANERNNQQQLQHHIEQQMKHDDISDEPLDCGIKHTPPTTASDGVDEVARNFITRNNLKTDDWKCKNERIDLH